MAAPAPETGGVEAQPVGHGQVFEPLSGLDLGPLAGLESPLLLVGYGLIDNKAAMASTQPKGTSTFITTRAGRQVIRTMAFW